MKFRFFLLGPDGDPNQSTPPPECDAGLLGSTSGLVRYQRSGSGMVRVERQETGRAKVTALTNFSARIVADLLIDDGEQVRREFRLEAELDGKAVTFCLSATDFARMDWVLSRLGPRAIVYAGQQAHARIAIQWLSGAVRQERIFAHLGWRRSGDSWVYLHAGGALGENGVLPDVQVQLPEPLQSYHLVPPQDVGARVKAVRASLGLLTLAPDRITIPLLAAVYRAALGPANFSLFLVGQSGVFKTAVAALCQQHFGAALDASRMPANFASTGSALEWLAFQAKDALLVVDDFAPTGRNGDNSLENIAEFLFRSVGNRQGRKRMSGRGQLSAPASPRGMVLATGEAVPQGASVRARLLLVEIRRGDVDNARLGECQVAGSEGQFSAAMAAYVMWTAGQYEQLQERLQARVRLLRNEGYGPAAHARVPAALAELQSGWEIFLEFALAVGAMGDREKEELERRGRHVWEQLAVAQIQYQSGSDPAMCFLAALRSALLSGQAHVADRAGRAPADPSQCGWRYKPNARRWVPQGTRIGWVAGQDLFLESTASYALAQQSAGGAGLGVSEQSMRYRLRDRGLLVSTDSARKMLTVRRTLEGQSRQVLHLRMSGLINR